MAIEVTDEMLAAFRDAVRQGGDNTDDIRAAGLAAVFALVERDHRLIKLCNEELVPGVRCTRETYGEPHRGDHEGKSSRGNTVRWAVS